MSGKLFLFPNLLGEIQNHHDVLPVSMDQAVAQIDGLFAESEKEGRRFLKRFSLKKPIQEIPVIALPKNGNERDFLELLMPITRKKETWGFVSDAGMPCIADPGAALVKTAHKRKVCLETFVGPSSIFLALVLSGMPAQRFSFHGYLDKKEDAREKQLKRLESVSAKEQSTHLFIETPYRNSHFLETALKCLLPTTTLAVAIDLTLPSQQVISLPIQEWKTITIESFNERPAIFLLAATPAAKER